MSGSSGPDAADRLALAALVRALPVVAVEDVLRDCGLAARRVRALPPWVTTYHVLASAMRPAMTYDDVTDLLWTTLPAATGRGLAHPKPTSGAVTRARARLGAEPLAALARRTARATLGDSSIRAVELHRYMTRGLPECWWITDRETGQLRGCDVGGDAFGAAVDLVRASGAAHVVVSAADVDAAALARAVAPAVVTVESAGGGAESGGALFSRVRARTPEVWRQDVLARACVELAAEVALRDTAQVPRP
ncbi:transposase domain-containing protein [Mycolicibacterium parafortuitum]|uniref:Putative transposase [Kitasatospora setae KM-6054] n=1 Tax=Mycolicibacterium parafortuitum TaxID=39692 RepID=A0A375YRR7_MYCPF|nr:transposase domain-containing protein [Mycolicibacterium parafortuitum]ORB27490.1 hypothetical protein BST38_24630 [Mycolicibacterium parafortuitum]SRX83812.1 putative transposase [Kitasatospora setae KM-6054] [Mycolicibacterium parafortuitum]